MDYLTAILASPEDLRLGQIIFEIAKPHAYFEPFHYGEPPRKLFRGIVFSLDGEAYSLEASDTEIADMPLTIWRRSDGQPWCGILEKLVTDRQCEYDAAIARETRYHAAVKALFEKLADTIRENPRLLISDAYDEYIDAGGHPDGPIVVKN